MRKKIITLILSFVVSLICIGQNQMQNSKFNGLKTHIDFEGNVYDWNRVNNPCYNCASFYEKIMITSSQNKYGYYQYYVFFYSNSYDKYGYLTNTYFTDLSLYVLRAKRGFMLVNYKEYILVPPKTNNYDGIYTVFIFNSIYPNEKFKITWNNIMVY